MIRLLLPSLCLAALLHSQLPAQSLFLDPIGTGPAVTVTGGGGPPASSVELFKNGSSAGSFSTSAGGQFSIPNIASTSGDLFQVSAGQVWNFNANGNSEGWNTAGDNSTVSGGVWQVTNSSGTDITLQQFTSGAFLGKFRAMEIRMRYVGASPPNAGSIQVVSANGNSWILNTFNLQAGAAFQTFVFDLGTDAGGNPTAWIDPSAPAGINIYLPNVGTNHVLEIDSIRLTESLNWEFDGAGNFAEWVAGANTAISNTGSGVLRTTSTAVNSNLFIARPFRVIGSTHFTQLETRLRQSTTQQPNLIQWNYLSNPLAYNGGGFQVAGLAADGNFQIINVNLSGTPTFGNNWGAGGGATLNVPGNNAFQTLFASASGQFTEIDYIRLHPAVRYGPSAPITASGTATPPSYYVSFSGGNDGNTGRSKSSPWRTFTNLSGLTLGPGSTVHLKRGDTWANSKLTLSGKGTPGNPVTLTAYGEGNRPRITGINLTTEPCIVWNNPSYVNIDSMDCRDAKVGLYLRFAGGNTDGTGEMFNNTDVTVTNCHFKNMDEVWSDGSGVITVPSPFELSWGAGIWIGGSIPSPSGGPWPSESTPILNNLTVAHCGFQECSTGVGMNFYFPAIYRSRFTNFRFEDSWVTGCENGSMALFYVDGGHARRVDTWLGGNGFYATGTTAGFIQHMQNFTIDDCQFAFNKQNVTGNDGTGFDYEGNTASVAFTNNVIHDNDGSGMLLIDSAGGNTGFNMSSNTFWNNCRKPKESGQNTEMRASANNTGTYTNNGIYRGAANDFGVPAIYNNTSRWEGYTGGTNNRIATTFATVSTRPLAWGFASSVESWGNSNQWSGFAASGGALVGSSTGEDPFVESPATWANSRERRWVLVRMSQTAGTGAQIFFETETSPGFAEAKSVAFPIIADGVMRDYVVNLGQSANYKGVITKWRLDPTNAAGSVMAIDRFDSMLNPYLATATPVASNIIDVRFNQAMHPDGGVFNPATYALSGLGQGTATSQPTSVSLISTSTGPVYRLIWASGHTNGFGAVLSASGATDARGNPLWTGSQLAITTQAQPIIDTDGDGMADDWEITYGLNPNNPADAALDKDGDGQSNAAEYFADTNPSLSSSRFRVTQIADSPTPGLMRVTWASQPGMVYYVEYSDSLASGSWLPVNVNPFVGYGTSSFLDCPALGERRFCRVRSHRPNPLIPVP